MSHENAEENEQMQNRIILDSGSTANLFFSSDIVKNINKVGKESHPKNVGVKINNKKD